jgi:FkbM family methyltransferase
MTAGITRTQRFAGRMHKIFSYHALPYGLRDHLAFMLLAAAKEGYLSEQSALGKFARKHFRSLTLRPKQLKGMRVRVDPFDESQLAVFDEIFVLNTYDFSLVPFTPDLIVDCGSHIGLFTARAATHFPRIKIVSFEPVPANASEVDWVVKRNRISAEVRRQAVGCENEIASFYLRCSCGGSLRPDHGGELEEVSVDVVDLRQLVKRWAPTRLLLKVDIEGGEESLLPALLPTLPPQCVVFFETHSADRGWNLLSDAFSRHNFEVKVVRQRDPYRDGVAVRNPPAQQTAAA